MMLNNIQPGLEKYKNTLGSFKMQYEEKIKSSDSDMSALRFLIHSIENIEKKFIIFEIYKNMFLSTYVAFETYLFRCFKFILQKYPTILSEKQFKLKDLFDSDKKTADSDLLLDRVIDKELHDLFYKSFKQILAYVKAKYSINHEISSDLIKRITKTRLVRNQFLHSGGMVNHIFLAKYGDHDYKVGDEIKISKEKFLELIDPFEIFIQEFDNVLVKKYPELQMRECQK